MDQAKETIFKNMPKFQIGTRPGHRAQEHLFVIKSVIALYEKYDKPVWLTTWDISKYFDSESLVDVLNELHRSGVQGKLYRLLYLMNRNVRIQVQTPVGPTSKMDTGETLGQGSVEGAVASAVNLANGVRTSLTGARMKSAIMASSSVLCCFKMTWPGCPWIVFPPSQAMNACAMLLKQNFYHLILKNPASSFLAVKEDDKNS